MIGAIFYQVSRVNNIASQIPQRQYAALGQWLADQNQMALPAGMENQIASEWIQQRGGDFSVSARSNPVEMGALIGLFVALLLVSLFGWRRKEIDNSLPSLQTIDALLYRTVGVAFPLLTLLLITGAVWANESWGRYWGMGLEGSGSPRCLDGLRRFSTYQSLARLARTTQRIFCFARICSGDLHLARRGVTCCRGFIRTHEK